MSVHRKTTFRDWIKENHSKWLTTVYVPAKCTSTCQPCDVILNRPFKAAFRFSFQMWVIEETERRHVENIKDPITFKAEVVKDLAAK
jgi:hypothetical protein